MDVDYSSPNLITGGILILFSRYFVVLVHISLRLSLFGDFILLC